MQATGGGRGGFLKRTAGYAIPFALLLALGLAEGGYYEQVFERVGLVVLWVLLLGLIAGAWVPSLPGGRTMLVAAAALLGLVVWSAVALAWSESAGRSAVEVARVLTYASIFLLVLQTQGGDGGRRALTGLVAAIAAIALVALASRVDPGLLGDNELAEQLPGGAYRLAYPVGYWNGLAALVAIGVPLAVWLASSERRPAVRIAAAAVAPVLVLVLYMTYSRTGVAAGVIGLLALLVLYPVRIALLPSLLTSGLGGGALVLVASRQDSLMRALEDSAAHAEGVRLGIAIVVVLASVAAVHFAYGRAIAGGRLGPVRRLPARPTRIVVGALGVFLVAAALLFVASGTAGEAFDRFREVSAPDGTGERLSSVQGNGRWQYWTAALEAGGGSPLLGIGPGTYELYWQRAGELPGFVRDAHSLPLESFAELGLVGLLLVLALLAAPVVSAVRLARRPPDSAAALGAAAGGAIAAYVVAAGADWNWEMPVVTVAFLIAAAAAIGHDAEGREIPARRLGGALAQLGAGLALLLAMLAIALPYLSVRELESSERRLVAADLAGASTAARAAGRLQPFAAAPYVQQALVHHARGDLQEAIAAIEEALEREGTSWQNWYLLSQLRAAAGDRVGAWAALETARRYDLHAPVLDEWEVELAAAEESNEAG